MAKNVEIRDCIVRHTGWKVKKIGHHIGNIYSTLSEHIHAPQRDGDVLVIRHEHLTPVQRRGVAALLCGSFNIGFTDSTVGETFDRIEKKAKEERE